MNDDLQVAHCVHCGRVYIINSSSARELCDCDAEMYPVTRKVVINKALIGADGYDIRLSDSFGEK